MPGTGERQLVEVKRHVLEHALGRAGWTQRDLAEQSGIARSTISKAMSRPPNRESISLKSLTILCTTFEKRAGIKLDADDLIDVPNGRTDWDRPLTALQVAQSMLPSTLHTNFVENPKVDPFELGAEVRDYLAVWFQAGLGDPGHIKLQAVRISTPDPVDIQLRGWSQAADRDKQIRRLVFRSDPSADGPTTPVCIDTGEALVQTRAMQNSLIGVAAYYAHAPLVSGGWEGGIPGWDDEQEHRDWTAVEVNDLASEDRVPYRFAIGHAGSPRVEVLKAFEVGGFRSDSHERPPAPLLFETRTGERWSFASLANDVRDFLSLLADRAEATFSAEPERYSGYGASHRDAFRAIADSRDGAALDGLCDWTTEAIGDAELDRVYITSQRRS